MPFKSEKQRKWMHANNPEMAKKWEKKEKKMKREQRVKELIKKMVREELAELDEAKKRDYKAEYKKYGSSTKSKKYRAELNAYNRKKGTYGNGDGKDASHKGGKIVGFEKESVNRGRAEKSRLKKEGKLQENEKNWNWSLDWESDISSLINSRELKTLMRDKNSKVKTIAQRLQKNLKQVHIGFDGLTDELRKVYGEGKLKEDSLGDAFQKKIDRYQDRIKREREAYKKARERQKASKDKKNEGKLTEAKETIFDVAARVMKDKQNQNYKSKVGMVKVDMQSANLLVKVFKKVNPKMKKILSDLGEKNPAGLMKTLWAVVK